MNVAIRDHLKHDATLLLIYTLCIVVQLFATLAETGMWTSHPLTASHFTTSFTNCHTKISLVHDRSKLPWKISQSTKTLHNEKRQANKQLSMFYRNEYTRVCIRRMQSMPDAIYFNTLAVSTPPPNLARIPICQPPCGSAVVCKLQHFFPWTSRVSISSKLLSARSLKQFSSWIYRRQQSLPVTLLFSYLDTKKFCSVKSQAARVPHVSA